ncbi:MAG: glycine cleavage T C-terminal barrel domain-containing protein, partial [Acidimicrobiales bacterium]
DGSVTFDNLSERVTTIGVWGPNAPTILARLTDHDLSQQGSPYGSVREADLAGIACTLLRISYVGDTGWEIHADWHDGPALWDALVDPGADQGLRPTGSGVYGPTRRLEKGYRLMGAELESEYNPVKAGLSRPAVKAADFIGREAYLAARDAGPAAIMCTLTVLDHTDSRGRKRYMQGGNEPILTKDGDRIVDAHGRVSRVTSAGGGPSVGSYLLLAYLPPRYARIGTELNVMYMNELFPVKVAATTSSIFDPQDARLRTD